MADLSLHERLQPSLLDRLTDEEPEKKKEAAERRFLTVDRLRELVKRDLAWLLNTSNLGATEDLEGYKEVQSSVLNYGIPDLTGHNLSNVDITQLERVVKQAIIDFEPRILRNTVRVRTFASDEMDKNALTFKIEGDLWGQPAPLAIVLRSDFDLESGLVAIRD